MFIVICCCGHLLSITLVKADKVYKLDQDLQSRSIFAKNQAGKPGVGAQASSLLGVGRKGSPYITIQAGETVELANIEGQDILYAIFG